MKKISTELMLDVAVTIRAYLVDFDGNLPEWKDAIYQMFRYQMTYNFAYQITVKEGRNGVFVKILAKPEFEKNAKTTMESLGFKNLHIERESIGVIEGFNLPEDLEIDYVEVEF